MQKVLIQDQEETFGVVSERTSSIHIFDVDAGCGATCSGNPIREELI